MLSLDVASSEFYKDSKYHLKGEKNVVFSEKMIDYLKNLSLHLIQFILLKMECQKMTGIGWKHLTEEIGNKIQLVGDDLFVTNIRQTPKRNRSIILQIQY